MDDRVVLLVLRSGDPLLTFVSEVSCVEVSCVAELVTPPTYVAVERSRPCSSIEVSVVLALDKLLWSELGNDMVDVDIACVFVTEQNIYQLSLETYTNPYSFAMTRIC